MISIGFYVVNPYFFDSMQLHLLMHFSFDGPQVLQIACAVAPNGPALLVFRFLGGCFAAAPLTNSGAILADM